MDCFTLTNLGVEVPIGSRWSVSADAYCSWWKIRKSDYTLNVLAGTVEGKYWLGNREHKPVMTGWNVGAYVGAGYYDFQFYSKNGYQGELFILGGLSAGYAHAISRSLRIEYSLGVGYLKTDYRKYHVVNSPDYGYIKVREYPWEDKRFSGIFPTKLAVSVVWMIGKKKGGVAHE